MQSKRLLFIVVYEVNVGLDLTVHVRDVGVAHMVGRSGDVENLGFVDELAGGLRVLIVVGQGLHDSQLAVGPVELNLSALVDEVVVVLAIVKVEIASRSALRGNEFDFWVDQQVDRVVNCLEQRHAVLFEVEQRDDALLTNEDSLLVLCYWDSLQNCRTCNVLPRPVVVPVNAVLQVYRRINSRVINQILLCWCTCLGHYKELVAKHELLIQRESCRILRELIPHRSDNWGAFFSCMLESRVKVVSLSVSLMNSI